MIPIFIFSFFLGLIVGSFLNVLICRLPQGTPPTGRSRCPHCHTTLRWHDLIPLLSFILLKRRCRLCRKKISWQYPVVEFLTAVIFTASVCIRAGEMVSSEWWLTLVAVLRDWIVASALIITAVIDLRHQVIFDAPLAITAVPILIINFLTQGRLWDLLLAGIIGASFFAFQYLVSKGKWIGGGDIVLGGFLGISLGTSNIFVALALAYTIGTIVAIPLLAASRYHWKSKIAFGTFLSLAAMIALFWGDGIREWYLNLIFM